MEATLVGKPGPKSRTLLTEQGEVLAVPAGWELLPPGDAAVTRKVKAAGPTWTMQEKRGRKVFSRGVWAPAVHIAEARAAVHAQRSDPAYQKKQEAARARRDKKEGEYRAEFQAAVRQALNFDARYEKAAYFLSVLITNHATPVGSGTVARTQRIPIDERARAAITAWMRHQTSAYDFMNVPRIKGARRALRREIAEQSQRILARYRRGEPVDTATCPLWKALTKAANQAKAK